jgi:hypothetical protein
MSSVTCSDLRWLTTFIHLKTGIVDADYDRRRNSHGAMG